MSLILDALNRSRHDDRQVPEKAPGLDSPHFREPPEAAGNRWLVLLAVALCIALGVIAWLLLARPPAGSLPKTPVPAAGRVATSGAGVATAPRPEPVVAVDRELPPEAAPAVTVAPPAETSAATTVAPASPVPLAAEPPGSDATADEPAATVSTEPAAPAAAVQDEEVAALYRQPAAPAPVAQPEPTGETAATPPPGREERPIDIEAMVAQAQAEMANRGLQDNPVPLLASLSQQFKDRVPSIMYLRHDYSGTPGKSTVVLNSKSLAPGGSLPGGVKVEEILPDSVILSYQGTRFRLRALNSWVNL